MSADPKEETQQVVPAGSSQRRGVLGSYALLLVGLPLYVLAVWGAQALGLARVGWFGALLILLVPAVIWLAHFYLLDRIEPEPTHYVLGAFLLGALVAAPLAHLLIVEVFSFPRWIYTQLSGLHVAAAFLVVGTSHELSKYVVVRYTLYLSDEFDEPADGIVYSTAVGIGFAVALRFANVKAGVVPLYGAVDAVIVTLSHACFSGAMGYALGRAKFDAENSTRLLAGGLLAAIALNGSFALLTSFSRVGLALSPWRGLALCGGFAAMVFSVVSYLMRRSLQAPEAHRAPAGAQGET